MPGTPAVHGMWTSEIRATQAERRVMMRLGGVGAVLQRNKLSAPDRLFLRFANLDHADRILRRDDARWSAGANALEHVVEFAEITILAFELECARFLAVLEQLQPVRTARAVVVRRRILENDRAGHIKTEPFGHRPTAFSVHRGAGTDLVLRHDVVNRAADFAEPGGKDAARSAETELDKVRAVDVQVEQRAPGQIAVEEKFLPPGRSLGDAAEPRAQDFAVRLF